MKTILRKLSKRGGKKKERNAQVMCETLTVRDCTYTISDAQLTRNKCEFRVILSLVFGSDLAVHYNHSAINSTFMMSIMFRFFDSVTEV